MIRLTHQREKCIGCAYCEEIASYRWQMNEKDGKSDLLESTTKKGIQIALLGDDEYDDLNSAASACPVKIIKVQKV